MFKKQIHFKIPRFSKIFPFFSKIPRFSKLRIKKVLRIANLIPVGRLGVNFRTFLKRSEY